MITCSKRAFPAYFFRLCGKHSQSAVLREILDQRVQPAQSRLFALQRLTSYNVGYRSFTEQYLDSCGIFKDAAISILAVIASLKHVRFCAAINFRYEGPNDVEITDFPLRLIWPYLLGRNSCMIITQK